MPPRRPNFDPAGKAARARQLTWQIGRRARRAQRQLLLLVPLTAGTLAAYVWREELFGTDAPVTREGNTQERVLRRTADGGSEDRSIDGDPERERDVPDRGMRVSE